MFSANVLHLKIETGCLVKRLATDGEKIKPPESKTMIAVKNNIQDDGE